MKDVARMFVATAVAAVVFVGLYVFLHWSLVISLLLAIGLYIGLTLFLKPSRKIAGIDVAEMPGGEALADLLDEADNDLTSIRSATKRILEPQVREQAQALREEALRVLPEQALVVTQILEAIYESAKTGKPVYFD